MVYRKRYGRRYRPRRVVGGRRRNAIKRWAGEKPTVMDKIARYAGPIGRIAKTVGGIMQMINPEVKYVDNGSAVTPVTNTGTVLATYTTMAQGLGDQARNGNTVKGKSISGKMHIVKSSSVVTSAIRFLWVLDKECDGALPTLSQILDSVDLTSGLNKDYSKRYAILKDKVFTLNDGGGQSRFTKFYFPTDFHVHFDGTSAAITDAKENQVFLFALSDQLLSTAVNVQHFGRFNYYDN